MSLSAGDLNVSDFVINWIEEQTEMQTQEQYEVNITQSMCLLSGVLFILAAVCSLSLGSSVTYPVSLS